jgi:Transposase DDE domain
LYGYVKEGTPVTTSIADIAPALQSVFITTADEVARPTGFVQRQSKLDGPMFAQTLTFGWLSNPHATLEELAQTATDLGVPISAQGLDQRFTRRAADFLLRVLQDAVSRVVTANPVAVPILQRFPGGVCLLDSTSLTLPDALADCWRGCGGTHPDDGLAAVKLQTRLNLLNGTLTGPFPEPGRVPDQNSEIQDAPLAPGTLRLADLGYYRLDTFADLSQQGVYWLSRVQERTRIVDEQGKVWTLAELLSNQQSPVDLTVRLGKRHLLPCRLIAVRVPPEVAEKRRARLRKKASEKGHGRRGRHRHNPERWALAAWTVYVSNVPNEMMSVEEALVLGRCRWQIELLFKLWKSEGHIDESRSGKPWRVLCEVYAKLLGMVVQHWLLLVSCWRHPARSLVKASRTIRQHALALGAALRDGHMVYRIVQTLQRCLANGCRINKRRRAPPTHQLLLNLSETG